MSSRAGYVRTETLISVAINTVLSLAFVHVVFHAQARIPVLGAHGIVPDMAPQTFMVTLMACLVPGLLTRQRLLAGRLPWVARDTRISVGKVIATAIASALVMTGLVVGLCWALLPHLLPNGLAFTPLLLEKAVYGALLAAVATPWAIRTFTHTAGGC